MPKQKKSQKKPVPFSVILVFILIIVAGVELAILNTVSNTNNVLVSSNKILKESNKNLENQAAHAEMLRYQLVADEALSIIKAEGHLSSPIFLKGRSKKANLDIVAKCVAEHFISFLLEAAPGKNFILSEISLNEDGGFNIDIIKNGNPREYPGGFTSPYPFVSVHQDKVKVMMNFWNENPAFHEEFKSELTTFFRNKFDR